jgi:hypothetical protein
MLLPKKFLVMKALCELEDGREFILQLGGMIEHRCTMPADWKLPADGVLQFPTVDPLIVEGEGAKPARVFCLVDDVLSITLPEGP